ncbi:MAG: hypothetical protein ACRDTF_05750, partial [Pseudonocardiaceae bacterium]
AEQADHDGLRAWICGLQSLISYWARRHHDSIRYAQRGAAYAQRAGSTTTVWLHVSEACAWAALGNAEQARAGITCAEQAWDRVRFDELDEVGGIATFSRARLLHFAAGALISLPDESSAAENYARLAVAAYSDQTDPDWSFGGAAGSRAVLAIARIRHGEVDEAAEALAPVFGLPAEQRINGIVQTMSEAHRALNQEPPSAISRELQERIEIYIRTSASLRTFGNR